MQPASHGMNSRRLVRRSLQYDTMDEMLHLVHQIRAPVNKYTLVGVRQLFYNDFADIQVQLGLTARAWDSGHPAAYRGS